MFFSLGCLEGLLLVGEPLLPAAMLTAGSNRPRLLHYCRNGRLARRKAASRCGPGRPKAWPPSQGKPWAPEQPETACMGLQIIVYWL